MCKQLKGILFPLNLLGRKKQCFVYEFPATPYNVSIEIRFLGLFVQCSWRSRFVSPGGKEEITDKQIRLSNADGQVHRLTLQQTCSTGSVYCVGNKVYFNCTNVTSLTINGERYI